MPISRIKLERFVDEQTTVMFNKDEIGRLVRCSGTPKSVRFDFIPLVEGEEMSCISLAELLNDIEIREATPTEILMVKLCAY